MLHVNAFDKFIKKHAIQIMISITALLVISVIGIIVIDHNNEIQSIDYKNGYNNGFNEVNVTRYNAARQIVHNNPTTIRYPPNVAYADGYTHGYEDGLSNQANAVMGYVPHN